MAIVWNTFHKHKIMFMFHEWGIVSYYCTPVCRLRIQNCFFFSISIMQHAIKAASLTVWWRCFKADVLLFLCLKLSVLNMAKGQTRIPETQKLTEKQDSYWNRCALSHHTMSEKEQNTRIIFQEVWNSDICKRQHRKWTFFPMYAKLNASVLYSMFLSV